MLIIGAIEALYLQIGSNEDIYEQYDITALAIHEIIHVLGFGTLWEYNQDELLPITNEVLAPWNQYGEGNIIDQNGNYTGKYALEAYSEFPSFRVGFTVTDSLITPEDDESLKDNAQGSSNVNAPGAHRLKKTLTLAKKSLTATDDSDFVELMKIENGSVSTKIFKTEP